MSRKYSFVALDLDGTTLNDDHEFSSSTVEILRKLDSLGVTICFATGRSTKNVEQYILQLDLDQNIPVVCFNGSYGFQRLGSTMSPIFEDPLPAAVTSRIISFGQECGCVCQVQIIECADGLDVDIKTAALIFVFSTTTVGLGTYMQSRKVTNISCYFNDMRDWLERIKSFLTRTMKHSLTVYLQKFL